MQKHNGKINTWPKCYLKALIGILRLNLTHSYS